MTVSTYIVNAGNHPDDEITVSFSVTDSVPEAVINLKQGKVMNIPGDAEYRIETVKHGSGDCLEHAGFAICVEGPGAELVRADFNPSASDRVTRVKQLAAALINEIHHHGKDGRCTSLAKTGIEEAAMWAVKSLTK